MSLVVSVGSLRNGNPGTGLSREYGSPSTSYVPGIMYLYRREKFPFMHIGKLKRSLVTQSLCDLHFSLKSVNRIMIEWQRLLRAGRVGSLRQITTDKHFVNL